MSFGPKKANRSRLSPPQQEQQQPSSSQRYNDNEASIRSMSSGNYHQSRGSSRHSRRSSHLSSTFGEGSTRSGLSSRSGTRQQTKSPQQRGGGIPTRVLKTLLESAQENREGMSSGLLAPMTVAEHEAVKNEVAEKLTLLLQFRLRESYKELAREKALSEKDEYAAKRQDEEQRLHDVVMEKRLDERDAVRYALDSRMDNVLKRAEVTERALSSRSRPGAGSLGSVVPTPLLPKLPLTARSPAPPRNPFIGTGGAGGSGAASARLAAKEQVDDTMTPDGGIVEAPPSSAIPSLPPPKEVGSDSHGDFSREGPGSGGGGYSRMSSRNGGASSKVHDLDKVYTRRPTPREREQRRQNVRLQKLLTTDGSEFSSINATPTPWGDQSSSRPCSRGILMAAAETNDEASKALLAMVNPGGGVVKHQGLIPKTLVSVSPPVAATSRTPFSPAAALQTQTSTAGKTELKIPLALQTPTSSSPAVSPRNMNGSTAAPTPSHNAKQPGDYEGLSDKERLIQEQLDRLPEGVTATLTSRERLFDVKLQLDSMKRAHQKQTTDLEERLQRATKQFVTLERRIKGREYTREMNRISLMKENLDGKISVKHERNRELVRLLMEGKESLMRKEGARRMRQQKKKKEREEKRAQKQREVAARRRKNTLLPTPSDRGLSPQPRMTPSRRDSLASSVGVASEAPSSTTIADDNPSDLVVDEQEFDEFVATFTASLAKAKEIGDQISERHDENKRKTPQKSPGPGATQQEEGRYGKSPPRRGFDRTGLDAQLDAVAADVLQDLEKFKAMSSPKRGKTSPASATSPRSTTSTNSPNNSFTPRAAHNGSSSLSPRAAAGGAHGTARSTPQSLSPAPPNNARAASPTKSSSSKPAIPKPTSSTSPTKKPSSPLKKKKKSVKKTTETPPPTTTASTLGTASSAASSDSEQKGQPIPLQRMNSGPLLSALKAPSPQMESNSSNRGGGRHLTTPSAPPRSSSPGGKKELRLSISSGVSRSPTTPSLNVSDFPEGQTGTRSPRSVSFAKNQRGSMSTTSAGGDSSGHQRVSPRGSMGMSSSAANSGRNVKRKKKRGLKSEFYTTKERRDDSLELLRLHDNLEHKLEKLSDAFVKEQQLQEKRREKLKFESRRSVADELRGALKQIQLARETGDEELTEDDKERINLMMIDGAQLLDECRRVEQDLLDTIDQREAMQGSMKDQLAQDKRELEQQIGENILKRQKLVNTRQELLQSYWQWRQRREIGDATAAPTFTEELDRGPPFKDVGVQNEIQVEFLPKQVLKMVHMMKREEVFRHQVNQIQSLVMDVDAVNEALKAELTCPVCGDIVEDPMLLWPCGHTFCSKCIDKLSVGPSVHRCHVCGTISTEGAFPNNVMNSIVGRWLFQSSGFSSLTLSVEGVVSHLDKFKRVEVEKKIGSLSASIAMSMTMNKFT